MSRDFRPSREEIRALVHEFEVSIQPEALTRFFGLQIHDSQLTGSSDVAVTWLMAAGTYVYGTQPSLPADSPDVAITRTRYDASGRVIESVAADGGKTSTEYDGAGQVVARVDALGRRTTTTYDALGRVTKATKPDGTSTSTGYDG